MNNFLLIKAFELGRWLGQVDLEEHYDNEQYARCAIESIVSKKTAMPLFPESQNREVTITLRSQKWREGVKKTTEEELQKLLERLT